MDTHTGHKRESFTNLLNTKFWSKAQLEAENDMLLIQELLYGQTSYLQSKIDIRELHKLRHEIDTHL